ncbi:4-hydroxy-tetrahydrodipicolinate synthase [Dialister micraerophilus]|uniref:4-hydroxy-tetrahydrodipicolinate synthase n=1 Tax=Dialister micraerophilus DSM 19965 TaxID=888062 RepID=F2BVG9_9FIRM|nr:4-hydroxy-tetrahydrodipicolinate synthase [Dialister micraerophilus]EGF16710.1 dihydrodipicolinate synthase [Dialister micraerophilus DSM 19965]
MNNFGRVITAMITPFDQEGNVNYGGVAELSKYLVDHGSEGILAGGTTGEGATLSEEEKIKLYKTVIESVGDKAYVIGNAGGIDTESIIRFIKKIENIGLDALLVIVPFYVKPTQEGMYRHFKKIADSTKLPIILYNVPGRTGANILPETVKRLTDVCENIVGIKDAVGNWEQTTKERILLPENFLIYSGDDSFTLPLISIGGAGVISVASHIIGDEMLELVKAAESGNLKEAAKIHLKYYRMMKELFFITNPIPVKTAINLMGLPGGTFRLPMVEASEKEENFVKDLLKFYGKI